MRLHYQQTVQQYSRVAVIDDAITEDDETVVLSATTSDSQITDSSDTGLGTIKMIEEVIIQM
ncbi:hypothetical protein [Halarcobacter anaerophilus]|uniref:hypothetical protein n=1 Tax=Halarcobacter anaerophilus TaxID=877500 RepID=UPI0005C9E770|nr:hypothetical protein [Halarcobacter anaerophilus]